MKFLKIKFPNGDMFNIGLRHIAENRAKYYADKEGFDNEEYIRVWKYEFDLVMEDNIEAIDWALGNMDWKDVERYAKKIDKDDLTSYEAEWSRSEAQVMNE